MIESGTNLGRYLIRSQLGAGGMGEVYLADDVQLNRNVALKILPPDLAVNRDRIERFIREAKAAAALNHPHIAHIYEIGEANGLRFIAMEFIDGFTLRDKIHRERTQLPKLLKWLTQVAEGLAKAHSVGIVHRDLKPGVGLALYNFTRVLKPARPSIFQNVTVSRITTSGRAMEANISPDGKYVVYLETGDDGNRGLFVKQTATGNTIPIVPPTKGNVLKGTSFSPDGNFVYYLFTDRTKRIALYQVYSRRTKAAHPLTLHTTRLDNRRRIVRSRCAIFLASVCSARDGRLPLITGEPEYHEDGDAE